MEIYFSTFFQVKNTLFSAFFPKKVSSIALHAPKHDNTTLVYTEEESHYYTCKFKEDKGKRMLQIEPMESVSKALEVLNTVRS